MNTIELAQEILNSNALFLDTETTGLSEHDEIVQIAGLIPNGHVVFDDLIKPTHPIPQAATAIHGITNADTEGAQFTWSQIAESLKCHSETLPVCAYNAVFDLRMIKQTNHFHRVAKFHPTKVYDAMELANRHFHKHLTWDYQQSKFKRLSLIKCCEIAGIEFEGKAHTALADAKATLELVKFIACDY